MKPIALSIGLIGILLIAGCTQQPSGTITIGAVAPLTGEIANLGINMKQAVELATDEINAAGGINGKRLEVIFEDGKCNAKDAADAANKLITLDKVPVVIGGLCSGETLAMAPIAEQNAAVILSPCSSAPKVSEAGEYVFRTYPSDLYQGVFAANYAYTTLGVRKVALLNTIGDWGTGLKDQFKKRFLELGGQITTEESFEQNSVDMRTQLTKIKTSGAELLYMPAYAQGAGLILKQAKELGISMRLMGGDGSDDPNVITVAGSAAEGFQLTVANPGSGVFSQKFKQRFNEDVLACASYAYDATNIIAQAITASGTQGSAIKTYLYGLKNYPGASGSISFDTNGDRTTADYIIKEVKDGKLEVITPGEQKPLQGSVKLGATLPLTGDLAGLGQSWQYAVQLATDEINANGGINGKKLEIIFEDDKCDGKTAVSTVTKLISFDKVPAIIGPACSTALLPAAPLAEQNKVILFSGSATAGKITTAGDYIFRNVPSDSFQGKFAAEFVFTALNSRKVAIAHVNEEYSAGLKDTFKKRFEELGGTIVAIEANERGATDLRTQLLKIQASNPDVIFRPTLPADEAYFLKTAREMGIMTQVVGTETSDDAQTITIAQDAANGLIYTLPKQTVSANFKERYQAMFNAEPMIYAERYYDAAQLLAASLKACGSDATCMKNRLYQIKDYPGAGGITTFDQNGDLTNTEYELKTIVNKTAIPWRG